MSFSEELSAEIAELFYTRPAWDEDNIKRHISPRHHMHCARCDRQVKHAPVWSLYCSKKCYAADKEAGVLKHAERNFCKCGKLCIGSPGVLCSVCRTKRLAKKEKWKPRERVCKVCKNHFKAGRATQWCCSNKCRALKSFHTRSKNAKRRIKRSPDPIPQGSPTPRPRKVISPQVLAASKAILSGGVGW